MKTPVKWLLLLGLVAGASAATVGKCQESATATKECGEKDVCCMLEGSGNAITGACGNGKACMEHVASKKTVCDFGMQADQKGKAVCNEDKAPESAGNCKDANTPCPAYAKCCKREDGKATGTCVADCDGLDASVKCKLKGKGQLCKDYEAKQFQCTAANGVEYCKTEHKCCDLDKKQCSKDCTKENKCTFGKLENKLLCDKKDPAPKATSDKQCMVGGKATDCDSNDECCDLDKKQCAKDKCKDLKNKCTFSKHNKKEPCNTKDAAAKEKDPKKKCKKETEETCLKTDKCCIIATGKCGNETVCAAAGKKTKCTFADAKHKDQVPCVKPDDESKDQKGGGGGSGSTKKPSGATTAVAAGPLIAGLLILPNLIPNNN